MACWLTFFSLMLALLSCLQAPDMVHLLAGCHLPSSTGFKCVLVNRGFKGILVVCVVYVFLF